MELVNGQTRRLGRGRTDSTSRRARLQCSSILPVACAVRQESRSSRHLYARPDGIGSQRVVPAACGEGEDGGQTGSEERDEEKDNYSFKSEKE